MKKLLCVLFVSGIFLNVLYAQEFSVSGEFKTGVLLENEKIGNKTKNNGRMHNSDGDSGGGEGRARINMHLAINNVGLKARFQQEDFETASPFWDYAYAYADIFSSQLRISAGLLGNSPWGTGGKWLNQELETFHFGGGLVGIRFEYMPSFLDGLNIGFVLNQPDQRIMKDPAKQKFGELLQESVIGIAYEHEYFAAQASFRLDSDMDAYESKNSEGSRLAYRIEEKALNTIVNGMSICMNGYFYGIGANFNQPTFMDNWLYFVYDNPNFIANLDILFGLYETNQNVIFPVCIQYQALEFYPGFYYKFFNDFLQVGMRFGLGMEFGKGVTYKDSFYRFYMIEPQIKMNIGSNSYVSLVYNFTDSFISSQGDKSLKHSLNLRAVYTF